MTKQFNLKIGERDWEILGAIDRCPLSVAQLLRLSETFGQPFCDEHNLRRRLRELAAAGLLKRFPYALTSDGRSPNYWKLTQEGYRTLYGNSAAMPKRRYFEAIRPGHHYHTFCLAELLVHLSISASKHDCEILHFARENSLKLEADPFVVYPDAAFVIRSAKGRTFPFVIELDNGTERVRSKQDVESIERKIRGYDAYQARFEARDPDRFLVVFVTTRSEVRLQHILDTAAQVMSQPQRRVFVGASLEHMLQDDPFKAALLSDHRGLRRQMIPLPSVRVNDSS